MYIFLFVYLSSFDKHFCVYYLGAQVLLTTAEIESKLCFVILNSDLGFHGHEMLGVGGQGFIQVSVTVQLDLC